MHKCTKQDAHLGCRFALETWHQGFTETVIQVAVRAQAQHWYLFQISSLREFDSQEHVRVSTTLEPPVSDKTAANSHIDLADMAETPNTEASISETPETQCVGVAMDNSQHCVLHP